MTVADYLRLLRLPQWYKNVVVFLALFFSGNFLDGELLLLTVRAFLALSLLSSANYIINDLLDAAKDRLHPEKKLRPLAAETVSKGIAIFLAFILLGTGLWLGYGTGKTFLYALIWIFLLSQLYNLWLKNVVFADILTIGTLFVLRAIAGALVIEVRISPWLILCPFFLSLFLSVGKRHAEVHLLKEKAGLSRKVLWDYTHDVTNSLMIISTTLFIISYGLYSFLSEHPNLIYTLPFALFVVFRFYYLVNAGSRIAREAERLIFDRPLVIGLLLWIAVTAVIVYG